ncbi:hypothetical protein Bhyg_09542 [Pseudolycoriella hygida]|uniref:Uncharacterized protein n=1 Tax=Pseudolycoriella hygida TaxID=35572 RepID=A0A9Q0N6P0_9DIPT|nr:hypothetical protein Bhyg_09542 [Pseudolycoriella hygida]
MILQPGVVITNCHGRRYEQRIMTYDGFPDILPDGEYRLETILSTVIDGMQRNFARLEFRGSIHSKTAVQWKK